VSILLSIPPKLETSTTPDITVGFASVPVPGFGFGVGDSPVFKLITFESPAAIELAR
jgi:hypothetical protein